RREIDIQARTNGFVVLAKTQHHSLFLLIDHIHRAVQPKCCQHRQRDTDQPQATGRRTIAASRGLLAAKDAIEAVLQLTQGLIKIRRPLASTALATTPGILIVRVATRLIPSHSALQTKNAKTRPLARRPCYRKREDDGEMPSPRIIAKYVAQ